MHADADMCSNKDKNHGFMFRARSAGEQDGRWAKSIQARKSWNSES